MTHRVCEYLFGVSLLALAGPSIAQTPQGERAIEEVVVTGTRIQSTGYERPTPVTVVTAEQLVTTQPAGIATALIEMPQFSNSTGPRTSASNTAGVVGRGNYLNLRNLGANRSLILQDGVRVPPTGGNGQVSVDIIPELLVQRVDVVTGGTAAVYGSDAVAGVVNFVLDREFKGLKGVAQGGVSHVNDLGNYKVGAAYGASFMGERGHLLLSASRSDAGGIEKKDRDLMNHRYLAVPLAPPGTRHPVLGVTAGQPGSVTNPFYIRSPVVSNTNCYGGNGRTSVLADRGPDGVCARQWPICRDHRAIRWVGQCSAHHQHPDNPFEEHQPVRSRKL
jgi:outer membrane receptor protein involved in Fe transport